MSDTHDDRAKKGGKPEANRRWFLRRLSALGGGAVAGLGAASRRAEAQASRAPRTAPRVRTRPGAQLQGKAATPLQFKGAFESIKATGRVGPTADKAWAPALRGLSASDRVAAVAAMELSQRNAGCEDIAGKAAALLGLMNVRAMQPPGGARTGLRGAGGGAEAPGVVGPTVGPTTTEFAGGACGGACSDTTGLGCGGGCADSTGLGCGAGCLHIVDAQYSFDTAGNLISGRDLASVNMVDVTAAMTNAAQAYQEVFGEVGGVGPGGAGQVVR